MTAWKLISPALALVCLTVFSPASMRAADQCIACHEGMEDKPSTQFKHDVHRAKGIGCADCHGGNAAAEDPDKAMDKKGGFIGVPKSNAISNLCATCHASPEMMKKHGSSLPTNQFDLLKASAHGKASLAGGEQIVQCTTCHNAHGVADVHSPASPVSPRNIVATCTRCHANAAYMRSYNPSLPVDQLDKYRTSVHGIRNAKGDVKTAECASCHGSHNILPAVDAKSQVNPLNIPATCAKCHGSAEYMKEYKIPTDQYEKYITSVHGVALLQKHDQGAPACNSCHGNHGATPPGLESISKVCGTCHALNADLFSSSPHKKAFDQQHLPECETCHSNHGIVAATETMLGDAPGAVCGRCHTPTKDAKGFVAAGQMRRLVDSLSAAERLAATLVDEAEQKGMDVGEAKFKLRDVRQSRLQSRTVVHAFDEKKEEEVVSKGLAAASVVQDEAHMAIHEYYFRRIGLGIATLIITLVGLSLYLMLRRMERKKR